MCNVSMPASRLCSDRVGNTPAALLLSICVCSKVDGRPLLQVAGTFGFHGEIESLRIWHGPVTEPRQLASTNDCSVVRMMPDIECKVTTKMPLVHLQ